MFRNALKPGQKVAEEWTYAVYHYRHRISHAVTIPAGTTLPACATCGERVRFEAAPEREEAPELFADKDFTLKPAKKRKRA